MQVAFIGSTRDDRDRIARAIADPRFAAGYAGGADLAALRAGTDAISAHRLVRQPPTDVAVTATTFGGVGCEWLVPAGTRRPGTIVYLHGGGFVRGSLGLGRANAATIARAASTRVLAVGYRQAPEHRFPAAPDDVDAVLRALQAGAPGEPVVLVGESSGGTLALGALATAGGDRGAGPAGVAALSPLADLALTGASWRYNAAHDVAKLETGRAMIGLYVDDVQAAGPRASPCRHHFRDGPPLLLAIGSHETMLSDVEYLARKASDAGATVRLDVYEAMPHGFTRFEAPIADTALARTAEWCAGRLADAARR